MEMQGPRVCAPHLGAHRARLPRPRNQDDKNMSDHDHELPATGTFNQVIKCPECGRTWAWFGFWAEIGR